jgi:ABC-type multidrug transport system fused ATPase/permease subunit
VRRILFRFLSNYLAHKAAWYLVGDLRTKVIENGRITEEGTHEELVALGGSYARMNYIQSNASGILNDAE